MSTVRVCHLYPGELNIYADRGNIAVLRRRLEWRGHALEVIEAGIGEPIPDDADMYYLGGGQDRDQVIVADDLAATKADALRQAVAARGRCCWRSAAATSWPATATPVSTARACRASGVLDADTVAGPTRLIGDVVITVEIAGASVTRRGLREPRRPHDAGRRAACRSARVRHGHGNNDMDRTEGAVTRRAIGTYLHGPLLPKNPRLADLLLGWALEHATGAPVAAGAARRHPGAAGAPRRIARVSERGSAWCRGVRG